MFLNSQIFIILICFFILIFLIFFRSFYEITHYKIVSYIISNKKTTSNFKICFISDFHNKKLDFNKIIHDIELLKPDYILIGGDSITVSKYNIKNSKVNFDNFKTFFLKLSRLNIKIYYSLGNHELRLNLYQDKYKNFHNIFNEFIDFLKTLNITMIDNQHINLSENICLYGISLFKGFYKNKFFSIFNRSILSNEYINKLLGDIDNNKYNICLSHNPHYAKFLIDYGFDLVLSGHYHGGIIQFPFIGCILSPELELFPKFSKGIYELDKKHIIVTSGLGEHSVKFRLNNFCEICNIDIINE